MFVFTFSLISRAQKCAFDESFVVAFIIERYWISNTRSRILYNSLFRVFYYYINFI